MKYSSNFIGIEGLKNLKKYIMTPEAFHNDCMDKNIHIYVESIYEEQFFGDIRKRFENIRIAISSSAKTHSQRIQDIMKIYKLIRLNNYKSIQLEINDIVEPDKQNKKMTYLDANITIEIEA